MNKPGSGPAEAAPIAAEYVVHLEPDQVIFNEGDVGEDMYIIQKGEVEIVRRVYGEDRRVALLEEGDFFGEMALLEDLPRVATARTVSACELLRIDGSVFDQMVRHNPEIPVRMLRKLARRLREMVSAALSVESPVDLRVDRGPVEPPPIPTAETTGLRARLFHVNSGQELPLRPSGETYIGRADPATGFEPDIELKPLDPDRSTSRRHARVIVRDGSLFLREEIGVVNGTFVNDERLSTGVEVALTDGDEVKFGLVKTVLRID